MDQAPTEIDPATPTEPRDPRAWIFRGILILAFADAFLLGGRFGVSSGVSLAVLPGLLAFLLGRSRSRPREGEAAFFLCLSSGLVLSGMLVLPVSGLVFLFLILGRPLPKPFAPSRGAPETLEQESPS